MIKKILQKKHKGNGFGDILATSVCLLFIIIVIIAGTHFFKLMEIKKNINTEIRAGLLILEQKGELSEDNINNIKESISKLGFSEGNVIVKYNKDNKRADYGEEVSITIEAKASNKELRISNIFGLLNDEYKYNITLHSISKAEE